MTDHFIEQREDKGASFKSVLDSLVS